MACRRCITGTCCASSPAAWTDNSSSTSTRAANGAGKPSAATSSAPPTSSSTRQQPPRIHRRRRRNPLAVLLQRHLDPIPHQHRKVTAGTSTIYYWNLLRFFARGLDGQLIQYIYEGGQWRWEALGGNILGTPDVIVDTDNNLRVFTVGADGTPWQYYFNGTWTRSPINTGKITAGTSTIYYWNLLRFFARGLDGQLIQYIYEGGQWRWEALGGNILGTPDVIVDTDNNLRVFTVGADGTPWQYYFNGTWTKSPINNGKIT
jgi:hypothetical protein